MEVGILADQRAPETMRRWTAAVEAANIDIFAQGDSQCMKREVYSTMALVAENSSSVRLPVVCTNPVTRHPTVTAGAIATVDEISDGRAILGMGTGDSAVRNTELTPATVSEVHDSMRMIRELLRTGRAERKGEELTFSWWDAERTPPIFLVGGGPKMLALGGEIADGVVYGGAVTPEKIAWARSKVRQGADDAGRDPDGIEFWTTAPCQVADTREEALDELHHIFAAAAHILSNIEGELDDLPEDTARSIRQLGEEYRPDVHNTLDEPHNAELIEKYDLLEFMSDRIGIAGTAEQVVDQLHELREMGVDGVLLAPRVSDPIETTERLGREVVPEV
jgi:5,10-methylenetetrahydromethanopterin reductase